MWVRGRITVWAGRVFGWIRRLAGVREKPSPQELLGITEKALEKEMQSGVGRTDFYYLLEEEKVPRELWPLVLGFMTRSVKLTYFDDREIRYLRWRVIAHSGRIQLAVDNMLPRPSQYASLADYRRVVDAMRSLPFNLEVFMLAVLKRSYQGFERKLEASRYLYLGR